MALTDLLAADRSILFGTSDFGEAVTYTAPDGQVTSLTAVVMSEYTEDVEQLGMFVRQRRRAVAVNRSELTEVNQQGTFTIGTVEYSVFRVLSEDDYVTVVELSRHELIEQARPGYRRR